MTTQRDLPLPRLLRHATDLTHRGRLAEATREIQRVLARTPAVASAPGGEAEVVAVVADGIRVLPADIEPVPREEPRESPDDGSIDGASALHAESPRSPVVARSARFSAGSHAAPGGTRAYKLFVPGGFDCMQLPLVVMLHGCTQDPDDFAAGTRMNALAQERGVVVLYPAQSALANRSKCWNWFQPGDQRRGAGEPAVLAALTQHVIATEDVDPQRVFVAGLSAGGAMAAIMAREYPELYRAVGVHSGLPAGCAHDVVSAFAMMKRGPARAGTPAPGSSVGTRVIVFHGDRDSVVHPRNGERIIEHSSQLPGMAVEGSDNGRRFTRQTHRDGSGLVQAEHWLIHGGAHAWSGGSATGSYADPTGPDASREMLRFFLDPTSGAAEPAVV